MAELEHIRHRAQEARARYRAEPEGDLAQTWLALAERWDELLAERQTAAAPAAE